MNFLMYRNSTDRFVEGIGPRIADYDINVFCYKEDTRISNHQNEAELINKGETVDYLIIEGSHKYLTAMRSKFETKFDTRLIKVTEHNGKSLEFLVGTGYRNHTRNHLNSAEYVVESLKEAPTISGVILDALLGKYDKLQGLKDV